MNEKIKDLLLGIGHSIIVIICWEVGKILWHQM